ncbi:serine protease [Mesobacillus maritimus]|uniref:S1C family serine protease n=1 Tax=Mesobacillus maritimus TaxID=1643336 RepID=UPI00203C65E9|nr:serine protease [Mesobacillus maritimus]MCM3668499.1 serine protease [Mesobacillus maritimus]
MDKDYENSSRPKNQSKQQIEEEEWEVLGFEANDEEWERTKERNKKRRSFIIKTISSLLVVTMLISGLQVWFNVFNIPAIEFLQVSNHLSKDPNVKKYKQAVVTIEWDGIKGTGFNISKNGLIVTNAHVVDHTNRVKVYFPSGESYLGEVTTKNEELDYALVKIESSNLPVLPMSFEADWETLKGEKILFIGNPLSFTQIANEGRVTGQITLSDRETPVMMIEAPVYRGNSGSPVLNSSGEVIGVLFATIRNPDGKNRVGVAVPSNYLKDSIQAELE